MLDGVDVQAFLNFLLKCRRNGSEIRRAAAPGYAPSNVSRVGDVCLGPISPDWWCLRHVR